MDGFGVRIRVARKELGLTQGELARRVGVGQQAVSNWERCKSRPEGETLERVGAELELDLEAPRQPAVAAGLPRLTSLPFANLDEYQFESFSADLMGVLDPGAEVNRFGGRGERQYGIDISVVTTNGERIGVQCKHMRKFHPASFDKALSELDREQAGVERCLLFLSSSATVKVQQRAAAFPEWQIWDADTLARKVRQLPIDAALRLVDSYFPGLREPFLGIQRQSPWETPKEVFDRFVQGDRFSHRWKLVGRDTELDALTTFVETAGDEARLGLIVGAAGGGKSRLLRAVAERLEGDDAVTVLLAPREPVESGDFELLPSGRRLVVMVDDAHEHGADLQTLVTGIYRSRPGAKVLMATRSYGLPAIREALRGLGIDAEAIPTWTLQQLSAGDARALAAEALGGEARQLAPRLAHAVGDCPLLLVAGAVQIRQGQLSTRLLETDERIRQLVADAFLRSATGGRADDTPVMTDVLRAVALLQPFRENVPAFQQAIAALTGQPFHKLTLHLKALEDEGVLLRRGAALRIVPDLLGDVILADAALTPATAASTGYLEEAYTLIQDEAEPLLNALVNASRIDWQWHMDQPHAPSLIAPLWNALEDAFKGTDPDGRSVFLPFLRQIGVFQPRRVLRLVRWLYAQQPGQELQLAMARVIEAVAYDLDCIDEALDLLWDLGREDGRALHATPDHPLRILSDLASFQPGKAFAYQESVIRAVQRWLESEHSSSAHVRMPLELLDPIFRPKAEWTTQEGRTVTIRRSRVPADKVQGLRLQALQVVYAEYAAADPCRSARAARTLEEVLRNAHGPDQQHISGLLSELRSRTLQTPPGPLAALAVRHAVNWNLVYGSEAAQEAAQAVVDALPTSLAHNLARALLSDWWTDMRSDSSDVDYQAAAAAWEEELRRVAVEASTLPPDQLFAQIKELLDQAVKVFVNPFDHMRPSMAHLIEAQPEIAEVICTEATRSPDRAQQTMLPAALSSLLRNAPAVGTERARALIAAGQLALAQAVASTLAEHRADPQIPPATLAALGGELADHSDPVVRQLVIRAARNLSQSDHAAAVNLVDSVPFHGSIDVAEEFSNAIMIYKWLNWSDLNSNQVAAVFGQLRDLPHLDKYEIHRLLASLSASRSEDVLVLLMNRVDHWNTAEDRLSYRPLPFYWHVPLGLDSSPRRVEFLRKIHQWIAAAPRGTRAAAHRHDCGPDLFRAVAGSFDHEVRQLLAEWFRNGDASEQHAAAVLIGAADAEFIWQEVPFVSEIFRIAARTSDELFRRVAGNLHNTVFMGIRQGSLGEPYPEDLQIRDRAEAIIPNLEPGSVEERFYRSLKASAEQMIAWELQEAPELDHRAW